MKTLSRLPLVLLLASVFVFSAYSIDDGRWSFSFQKQFINFYYSFYDFIILGAVIHNMSSYYQFNGTNQISPRQVLSLADKVLSEVLSIKPNGKISHLITATSCPDQLAPSMGQMIYKKFSKDLSETHILDLVQVCAGGTSALILGSELAQMHSSGIMVSEIMEFIFAFGTTG